VFSQVGDSALVLLVPEAEALVRPWRIRHDPSAGEGVPAHITVLYPFVPEKEIHDEARSRIANLCRGKGALTVTFAKTGRFPSVLWLDPDSLACSQLLREAAAAWPERAPYGRPGLVPTAHLTVTDGADAATTDAADEAVTRGLPLRAVISAVSLIVFDGVRWVERDAFTLL